MKSNRGTSQIGLRIGFPAAVLSGLGDLLEFVLPLWTASSLGMSPVLIGLVLATELAVAFVLRPFAGIAADKFNRAILSALGAALFCAGFLSLALAHSPLHVLLSAIPLGAGSAFFWVPLRAIVAGVKDVQKGFAQLTEYEGTGIWLVYIIFLSLLPTMGYSTIYGLASAACLAAAIVFLTLRKQAAYSTSATTSPTRLPQKKEGIKLLVFVASIALAEAAASVYLLLRAQQKLDGEIAGILWVYLPGLVVYSLVPQLGKRVSVTLGEKVFAALALSLSVLGIITIAFADQVWAMSLGWALLCWSWGWLDPLQQSTAIRVFPGGHGRALGRYESATLAGSAIGSLLGGISLTLDTSLGILAIVATVCFLGFAVISTLYTSAPAQNNRDTKNSGEINTYPSSRKQDDTMGKYTKKEKEEYKQEWRYWLGGTIILVAIYIFTGIRESDWGRTWPLVTSAIWAIVLIVTPLFSSPDKKSDE